MKCLMNRFSSRLGMREERISKHEDGSIEIAQLKDRRGKKKGGNLILCLCVCVCVHTCTCVHVCTHLCGFKGQLASEAGACQFSAHRLPANSHFSLALLCWYLVPCGTFWRFYRAIWPISHCSAPLLAYLCFCLWSHFLLYNLKLARLSLYRNEMR